MPGLEDTGVVNGEGLLDVSYYEVVEAGFGAGRDGRGGARGELLEALDGFDVGLSFRGGE